MSRGPDKQFDPEVALSRAMEVFWARGYEAASLSELLQRMRIGRKSMYDTFGNKRSLFLKTLQYYAQTTILSIRDRLSAPDSPLKNLKRLLRDLQKEHGVPGSKGCMLGTNIADFDTADKEMASVFRSYLKEVEEAFYEAVLAAQSAGELRKSIDTRALARMLLCMTQGMALVGRVLENETVLRGTTEAAMSLLEPE
ncbi:MAG TPA: helix-turn-helix domain-containing protein [Candidatus Binatia bacterium]|jgi:TetR/AcrR family transcriptional repressor of nem operon